MFSNGCKSNCTKFVGCVAVLSFIIGLVGCIYGALSFTGGNISAGDYSHNFDMSVNAAIGFLAIIAGILALIVGLLGCLTVKCMNCCTSVAFCLVAFIIGLLSIIVGFVVMSLDWEQVQTQVCNTNNWEVQG